MRTMGFPSVMARPPVLRLHPPQQRLARLHRVADLGLAAPLHLELLAPADGLRQYAHWHAALIRAVVRLDLNRRAVRCVLGVAPFDGVRSAAALADANGYGPAVARHLVYEEHQQPRPQVACRDDRLVVAALLPGDVGFIADVRHGSPP